MNIAQRTKTLAFSGLLAVLALTAAGCSTSPANSTSQHTPVAEPETARVKIADAPVMEDGGFRKPTGVPQDQWFTEAEIADIKKTGITALQIMLEAHPEYTVEGFKPTVETWNNDIAPKLQPISSATGWADMTKAWIMPPSGDVKVEANGGKFFSNPILTNSPDLTSDDTYPNYKVTNTWKSDNGEVCSPSDKQYDIDVKGVGLYSVGGAAGPFLNAYVDAQMDLIVHCKEGGKLTSAVDHVVYLKRPAKGGKFLVEGTTLMRTAGGSSVLAK